MSRRIACISLSDLHREIEREKALTCVAEAALAFGPATSFDIAQDVVWIDVSGCAHLRGGEIALARAIGERIGALGYACRVAIADGPRIAAAIARFGGLQSIDVVVAPAGEGVVAVRSLPIASLGLGEEVSTWLSELGLHTCGDLQKLPRAALASRLGDRVQDVMEFLDGRDHAPLKVWRPPEVPEERIELDWGAASIEALAFVLNVMCDRLAARLKGRAMGARSLELLLSLDRALCPPGGSHRLTLPVVLPSPITRASDLLAIVRARLETCVLAAPVRTLTLRAPVLARSSSCTLDWLAPQPKAERALPRLVAELSAEFGEKTVGVLELVDTWLPAERTRLVPYGGPSRKTRAIPNHSLVTSAIEPSRVICAMQVSRATLALAKHIARVDTVQWWRHAPTSYESSRHDLFMAWVDGALAWLERSDPSHPPRLCGWMD
jgi:protein ImuB